MRIILDIFSMLALARKLAASGLLFFIGRNYKKSSLIIVSYLFAPFKTIAQNFTSSKKINIHIIIEQLGPIFIKFGQSIATRPDLVGKDIALSLSNLQDKLQPFSFVLAKEIIERELRQKFSDIFDSFNEDPVAAASIAQVHKAYLKNGRQVAVKILRPDIERIYKKDIAMLYSIARIFNQFVPSFRRLRLIEAVNIFEKTMKFELNLVNEAAACSELANNLKQDKGVKIPEIFWDYSTSSVLVLEWIDGFSIYDLEKIAEYKLHKETIIKNLVVTFLNQAFRDGFFHADMHPGNLLVTKEGELAFVDFGIIGRLSEKDRFGLAEILHSIIKKDYKRVAEIHVEIGYIPRETNIMDFALAARAAAEPVAGKQIDKISIGHLLENLFKIIADFGMETQPQLILMQKTIVIVEGIAKNLNEEVNVWQLAEPWVQKWASQNISFDAKIYRLVKSLVKDLEERMRLS